MAITRGPVPEEVCRQEIMESKRESRSIQFMSALSHLESSVSELGELILDITGEEHPVSPDNIKPPSPPMISILEQYPKDIHTQSEKITELVDRLRGIIL